MAKIIPFNSIASIDKASYMATQLHAMLAAKTAIIMLTKSMQAIDSNLKQGDNK